MRASLRRRRAFSLALRFVVAIAPASSRIREGSLTVTSVICRQPVSDIR
jgi:hypothetical protein